MKKTYLLFAICSLFFAFSANAADDPFLFDNFAITEPTNVDITTEPVSMNENTVGANVRGFDIAGIFLSETFDDVYNMFFREKSLYVPRKNNSIVYTMTTDWKSNLDYECRIGGIIIPSELEQCINTLARNRGLLYASELHLVRAETGETIDVYFTSNATENVVWRVVYKNDVNDIEGAAEKFTDQRNKKILAFWQGVLEKYGAPNSGGDKWITSSNSYDPMMTAYYGSLDLTDVGANASDAAKNVTGARENFPAKPYAF